LCGLDQLLSKFRLLSNSVTMLLPPDLQKVVSEQLELSLKSLIVFSHSGDVLFQCFDFALGLLGQMELEDLNAEFALEVVVEGKDLELVLFHPSLHLV